MEIEEFEKKFDILKNHIRNLEKYESDSYVWISVLLCRVAEIIIFQPDPEKALEGAISILKNLYESAKFDTNN